MMRTIFFCFTMLVFVPVFAQYPSLQNAFKNPPNAYRPGCYYYWMNDHISKEGVQKDIEAMSEVGIGRAFIGNVGFSEEEMLLKQGPARLFSDEWWNVMRAAFKAGEKYNVDIGVFNSPGWSQSGGPWIKPSQAMRYLSIHEIVVEGPGEIIKKIDLDPLFQLEAVLAFQKPKYEEQIITHYSPRISSSIDSFNFKPAFDGDTLTGFSFPKNFDQKSVNIDLVTEDPFTASSLIIFPGKKAIKAEITLQARLKDSFETVKTFHFDRSNPSLNVGFRPWAPVVISFPSIKSNAYRIVVEKVNGEGGFAEICLTRASTIERYPEKQLAKMFQTPLPLWNEYRWGKEPEIKDSGTTVDYNLVFDISKNLSGNGTLHWQAPKGKWTVAVFGMSPTGVTNAPATPEGRGYDVDKINRQAVNAHFESFIGKIQKKIPAIDRKAFKYVVADSYETGSQNWTDNFADAFKKTYHYDPVKWLPVLTGRVVRSKDESNRFLWDLRRLVGDKVAYDYVGGLREACHKNGLGLWLENYGHWGFPSEFLKYGGQSDEVGGEFWAEGDLGSIECRAASSAGHIYGKNKISAESFTAGGNAFGRYPALLKKRGDWSFTEGINNSILHVYIQQPNDLKPGINAWFGTEFNRHNTWFYQGKAFLDYIRRCNYMLQQGKPVADIAYFIGEDAPKMTGITDPPLPEGYQFDYINAEVIERDLSVRDGRLVLPDGMNYRVLVLPKSETMRPSVLQKINRLVYEGAIVVGSPPESSPSLENYPLADREVKQLSEKLWKGVDGVHQKETFFGKGRVLSGVTMDEVFAKTGITADFKKNIGENILFVHRTTPLQEIYFITNQKDTTVNFTPLFRQGKGQPYFYDAVTGVIRKLSNFVVKKEGVEIPFKLDPYQSAFIVFHKNEGAVPHSAGNFPLPLESKLLNQGWTVYFDTGMRGPILPVIFNELTDWSKHSNDSIKNYSGKAIYKTTFAMTSIPTNAKSFLNLGLVKAMARVRLNGKDLGIVWTAPWQVDATKALKRGVNKLEIEVVNTWVNRLIGDSKLPPEQRKTWCNVNNFKADSPYASSGLIGPVKIDFIRF